MKNILKLLVVGVCDKPESTNTFMVKAFKAMGHEVFVYNYRTRARELGSIEKMWFDFIEMALAKKPYDLIIFCKVDLFRPWVINAVKKFGKTFYYFMDPLQTAKYMDAIRLAESCDYASATMSSVVDLFRYVNPHTYQIIEGFDEKTFFKESVDKKYDVVFIGTITRKRKQWLMALQDEFNVNVFGNSVINEDGLKVIRHEPIFNDILRNVINESLIVLNIIRDGDVGFSDRVIQTLACGTFLITEFCSDLIEYFERGIHFDVVRCPEEMRNNVRYWIGHKKDRLIIAKQGMEHVRKYFTWHHTCQKILDVINR